MSDPTTISAVVLLAIALIFFFLEVFIPSGGLLGVLAGGSLIAGIVMLFTVDTTLGLVSLIASLIAVPALLAFGLKVMPDTIIGRLLTLKGPPPREIGGAEPGDVVAIDAKGEAITDLRPIGTCLIDGKRLDCMAEAGVIEAGQPVRVVLADGMQIKVRFDEDA